MNMRYRNYRRSKDPVKSLASDRYAVTDHVLSQRTSSYPVSTTRG